MPLVQTRFTAMVRRERDIMSFPFPVPDTSNIKKKQVDIIYPDRISKMQAHICMTCENKVEGFNDGPSQQEFLISGMCQKCQNEAFDSGDDSD